jgi:hypothetical protein
MREKLLIEKAMDKEIEWEKLPRAPHCDARVLHKPEECVFCARATALQEERERLEVSNTGHANRKWPCPADKARSSQSLNAWHGNRALTQEDLDREDKEWEKLREKLKLEDDNAGVVE